jgi:hypothetical protein
MGDLFIALDHASKTLPETVLIQFFSGVLIPYTATIGRKFITQKQLSITPAKLEFEVD